MTRVFFFCNHEGLLYGSADKGVWLFRRTLSSDFIRNMERYLRCKTQHVGSLFNVDIMSEIVFKRY